MAPTLTILGGRRSSRAASKAYPATSKSPLFASAATSLGISMEL